MSQRVRSESGICESVPRAAFAGRASAVAKYVSIPSSKTAVSEDGAGNKGLPSSLRAFCEDGNHVYMENGAVRDHRPLLRPAPRARGVWGCAPVDKGGRFIGRRSTKIAGPFQKGQLFLWRWAESNRRPNKAPSGFLHAYPAFGCRGPAAGRRANGPLASKSWGAVEASAPASLLNDTPYTGMGRLETPAGYSSLRTWSARLS